MRDYELHGHRLRVTAQSPAWAEAVLELLGPHQTHSEVGPARAIEIELGDSTHLPDLPPLREAARAPQLAFHRENSGEVWIEIDRGGWVRVDFEGEKAEAWLSLDPERDGWRVAHHALYPALLELLKARGLFPLHAGAVCRQNDGVVLCGESGAGKTTLTLALALAGWSLLGEDTCFFEILPSGEPHVRALWEDAHLTPGTIRRLAPLAVYADRNPRGGVGKVHVPLGELPGVTVAAGCQPRWLLLPRVAGGRKTHLERVPAARALTVLTRQSLVPARAEGVPDHLGALTGLASALECWQVEMGEDLEEVVATLGSLWGPDVDGTSP